MANINIRGREGLREVNDVVTQTVWVELTPANKAALDDLVGSGGLQPPVEQLPHNLLTGIQGGNVAERYHLTFVQYQHVLTLPNDLAMIKARVDGAVLAAVGGNEMLDDVGRLDELDVPCVAGQVVYVRNENRFYMCNGTGDGWEPATPPVIVVPPEQIVDDVTDLEVPCISGDVYYVRNENAYYICRGDGTGWDRVGEAIIDGPSTDLNEIEDTTEINGMALPVILRGRLPVRIKEQK